MSAFCTQVLRYNILLNWDKTNALEIACLVFFWGFFSFLKESIPIFLLFYDIVLFSIQFPLRTLPVPSLINFNLRTLFSSQDIGSLSGISPGCLTFDHQQCPCFYVNYRKAISWFWDHTWRYLYSVILNGCLIFGSFLSLLIRLPNCSSTFVGKILILLKQFLPCFTVE